MEDTTNDTTIEDATVQFSELLSKLMKALVAATILLAQMLLVVLLGFLVAIVYALPWLIRAGGLLVWFYGIYRSVLLTMQLYAPFTDIPPLIALEIFVALIQFAGLLVVFKFNPRLTWGALYLIGGLSLSFSNYFIPNLMEQTHAAILLRLLPPVTWASLLIYITIRTKRRQDGKRINLFDQATLSVKVAGWLEAIDAFSASLLSTHEAEPNEGGGI